MSEPLVFMMGKFTAHFLPDVMYSENHMWAQNRDGHWRFGFTAYAVRLLQDVYFLDWDIEPDMQIKKGQSVGSIESSKAESSLCAPMTGRVVRLNEAIMADPSTINADNYGDGWLFELEGPGEALMRAEAYLAYLDAAWETAQKTIKGQLSE
jgi:glycine cleavage system H protein